jgi:hypothetical protein
MGSRQPRAKFSPKSARDTTARSQRRANGGSCKVDFIAIKKRRDEIAVVKMHAKATTVTMHGQDYQVAYIQYTKVMLLTRK